MLVTDDLRSIALRVLEQNWCPELRCTLPHKITYPHRWLWDSCFHAIAWSALERREGVWELESILGSGLPTVIGRGFLPHMVYGDPERSGEGVDRGPLWGMSAFTQPPVYVLALDEILRRQVTLNPWLLRAATAALDWLWRNRIHRDLIRVVHPWETGADISPRFDDWYGPIADYDSETLNDHYQSLVDTVIYDDVGISIDNPRFAVAPSGFNAIAADAACRLAFLTNDDAWRDRSRALAANLDSQLWDEAEGLWIDRSDRPRSSSQSARVPTLDGVLGSLGTDSTERAVRALEQCVGAGRFAAPFGPRYLPATHPAYEADTYWRGPTWPQLNFLLITAARRHGLVDIADELSSTTLKGVMKSRFVEYWNPETGEGRGAIPQSWAAVVVAL